MPKPPQAKLIETVEIDVGGQKITVNKGDEDKWRAAPKPAAKPAAPQPPKSQQPPAAPKK